MAGGSELGAARLDGWHAHLTGECYADLRRGAGNCRAPTQGAGPRPQSPYAKSQSAGARPYSQVTHIHVYIYIDIHVSGLSSKFWARVACEKSGTNLDCTYLYFYDMDICDKYVCYKRIIDKITTVYVFIDY